MSGPRRSTGIAPLVGFVAVAAVALLVGMLLGGTLNSKTCGPRASDRPSSGAEARHEEPGPSAIEHGIPVGFARDPDGAVAAAATYTGTGQALLDMRPAKLEAAVRAMAAEDSAAALLADTVARLEAARSALAGSDAPIDYHQAVLSVRVDGYSPERARVSIWSVGVLSREGVAAPQAGWSISTFDLVWERGDWKIAAESIVPGPAPITNAAAPPATSAQLRQRLAGFAPYGRNG